MGDPSKRYRPKQLVSMLREAEVELSKGHALAVVAKKLGYLSRAGQGPAPLLFRIESMPGAVAPRQSRLVGPAPVCVTRVSFPAWALRVWGGSGSSARRR